VKPFTREDLYASIEICLSNFQHTAPASSQKLSLSDVLFVKEGNAYHKIRLKDILYLESDHVYVNIVTTDRKFLVRASLQEYAARLDSRTFTKVHRSYLVNFEKVEKVEAESVMVEGREVPLSKTYRDLLIQQFNIK
jgi:two-component system, LytTR family, response regulator LytT